MRRFIVLLSFAIACVALSSCIVHTPGAHHPRGRGRCYTQCAQWAYRQQCNRSCAIWRGGVCIRYRQSCARQRYCVRNTTRCR